MRTYTLVLSLLILAYSCGSSKLDTKDDRKAIENVLKMQESEWNDYDLEGFMQGYWNSDELRFYGANGLTTGWKETLKNYKIRYPNKDHTGKLKFSIDNISQIDEASYYVMGRYNLQRKAGDANGRFMIIFKKINNKWKIIADMSS